MMLLEMVRGDEAQIGEPRVLRSFGKLCIAYAGATRTLIRRGPGVQATSNSLFLCDVRATPPRESQTPENENILEILEKIEGHLQKAQMHSSDKLV